MSNLYAESIRLKVLENEYLALKLKCEKYEKALEVIANSAQGFDTPSWISIANYCQSAAKEALDSTIKEMEVKK